MESPLKSLGPHPDFPECMVVCNESGDFCHTHPYPTDAQLAHYYQSEYREVRQEAPTADYIRFMDHRAQEQMKFITASTGRSTFVSALDIGCGAGRLVNALAQSCGSVRGYEADEAMAAFAHSQRAGNHIEIIKELFNPEPGGAKADLITMSHVLEHVPEPCEFLHSLREHALSPGGYLFLEVPNDPPHWVKKQVDWKLRGLAHLNYFTQSSFREMIESSGLCVLSVCTCGIPLDEFIRRRKPASFLKRQLSKALGRIPKAGKSINIYETSPASTENIYMQAVATHNQYTSYHSR